MTDFETPATPDLSNEQEAEIPVEEADPSRFQRLRKVGSDIIKMVITTDPREIAANLRQY
jgi:hypothetical protein